MSADLLAEFGEPEASAGEDGKKVYELSSMPPQHNEALIPNISDARYDAAPAGKTKDLPVNLWRRADEGADVLFDALADQYDLDDEFGDFQDGKQEMPQGQPASLHHNTVSREMLSASTVQFQSLLDFDGSLDPLDPPKNSRSQEHDVEWGDFSTAVSKDKPKEDDIGLPTEASNYGQAFTIDDAREMEGWEPFEDVEAPVTNGYTNDAQRPASDASDIKPLQLKSRPRNLSSVKKVPAVPSMDENRPTNIPPPAILLQILPKVFEDLAEMNHAHSPLQCYNAVLQAHTVASHLVAGCSLRWKRDNILSQNNKTGPAAAGKKGGGMKLAAIDRTESLKEEREVADVIQVWERHAHIFNSIVHEAGIRRPLMTLSKQSRPRAGKGAGVLTSHHACALCGLKRNERVPEADMNVDDSFGEFWLEHWGHRDCKDFWHKNQALLPQR